MNLIKRLFNKPLSLERRLYMAAHPLVATTFHGVPVMVAMRELTAVQIHSIGDMTMIKTFYDNIAMKREPTLEEMNEYAERHHKLLKVAMAVPTYDEMLKIAGAHVDQSQIDKELAELKAIFRAIPSGKEKEKLKNRYNSLELSSKFLLPADFTAPLVAWVSGTSRTDIDKITHDMLVKAYILSRQGHDNPCDHIGGNFERYPGDTLLKDDINTRAKLAYEMELEKNKKNGRG